MLKTGEVGKTSARLPAGEMLRAPEWSGKAAGELRAGTGRAGESRAGETRAGDGVAGRTGLPQQRMPGGSGASRVAGRGTAGFGREVTPGAGAGFAGLGKTGSGSGVSLSGSSGHAGPGTGITASGSSVHGTSAHDARAQGASPQGASGARHGGHGSPAQGGLGAGPGIAPGAGEGAKKSLTGLHALVVDVDQQVRKACRGIAEGIGFAVTGVASAAEARAILKRQQFDLLLLDLKLQGEDGGLTLLEEVKSLYPHTSAIVMTAYATVSSAVEAMRIGAGDYLTKPFSQEELTGVLQRASQKQHMDRESRMLRERLRTPTGMGDMIGRAPEMEKLYRILSKVAHSTHPVLILGESGTGKELVARSIHFNGPNAARPFVAVDCGSLVPTLIESELFGYVRGAFTGAERAKDGLLAAAEGGTVFLDEIGELPLDLQSKLLRALQEKEVRPVGATFTVPISARVLAATNRNLLAMVEQGRFRKDLYFRLNVVNLKIPPLRERREDIPTLALHFLERMKRDSNVPYTFSDEALRTMTQYDWPGNVRELENAVERACALSSGPLLHMSDLPTQLQDFRIHGQAMDAESARLAAEHGTAGRTDARGGILPIAEMERQAILETIRQLKGDKLMAAKLLGIGKTTLYRKLKEYGIAEGGEEAN